VPSVQTLQQVTSTHLEVQTYRHCLSIRIYRVARLDSRPGVLIVGAGPTGLTAAVELARRGVVADVVERRDAASNLSRAVGILPSSMKILAPSGVADAIRQEAVPYRAAVFHDEARVFARLNLNESGDVGFRLFGMAQDRTETHLRTAFESMGGRVNYAAELTGLAQDDSSVQVTMGDEAASYDYVIGADGVQSAVRHALGLDFLGHTLPEKWSIADVDCHDWPTPNEFHAYLRSAGRVVVVAPLERARFRIVSNTDNALETLPVPMNVTRVRREASFQISIRQVEHYQMGRVFLAGDAAHCHSPVGGRGMNLGIADAADLARRITEGGLDGYDYARHAAGKETITLSERGRRILTSRNPLVRGLAKGALRTVAAVTPLRRRAVHRLLSL
jgi:2-polyprenyl-6-methoxyphenol hydroxylase-like FAD-dependent oxidoreductase